MIGADPTLIEAERGAEHKGGQQKLQIRIPRICTDFAEAREPAKECGSGKKMQANTFRRKGTGRTEVSFL
jgi:hypothetical protein